MLDLYSLSRINKHIIICILQNPTAYSSNSCGLVVSFSLSLLLLSCSSLSPLSKDYSYSVCRNLLGDHRRLAKPFLRVKTSAGQFLVFPIMGCFRFNSCPPFFFVRNMERKYKQQERSKLTGERESWERSLSVIVIVFFSFLCCISCVGFDDTYDFVFMRRLCFFLSVCDLSMVCAWL